MRSWLNIGCGPFRAPEPWINTDVIRISGNVEPDILMTSWRPAELAGTFEDVERIYLGHVLEHVRWEIVGDFLGECLELLAPGGRICVVGPDVNRNIQRYHAGQETWDQVIAVLEDDVHYQTTPADWDGARHAWNCYEGRVVRALAAAGFVDVTALPITEEALAGWPVVAHTLHQCAAVGTKP
jgi:hypothetical protein